MKDFLLVSLIGFLAGLADFANRRCKKSRLPRNWFCFSVIGFTILAPLFANDSFYS